MQAYKCDCPEKMQIHCMNLTQTYLGPALPELALWQCKALWHSTTAKTPSCASRLLLQMARGAVCMLVPVSGSWQWGQRGVVWCGESGGQGTENGLEGVILSSKSACLDPLLSAHPPLSILGLIPGFIAFQRQPGDLPRGSLWLAFWSPSTLNWMQHGLHWHGCDIIGDG